MRRDLVNYLDSIRPPVRIMEQQVAEERSDD